MGQPFRLRGNQVDADNPLHVGFAPDVATGALASVDVTLSGTPGEVTVITLPDYARGFRLYPAANSIRFALGEDPDAANSETGATVAAEDFAVGDVALADQFEVRLIEAGAGQTLRLASATASVVVTVSVFA